MRKLGIIIIALFVAYLIVEAALVPVKIDSPGATGMNSNSDIQERKITDASYAENVNTQSSPGLLQRRFPLHSIGDNSVLTYAAFGFFDFANKTKQIVAVIDGRDSLIGGYRADTVFIALATDTMSPSIGYSDKFGSGIDDTVKSGGVIGPPPFRSVLFDGTLFITSSGSVPLAYSPYGATNTSNLFELDTAFYKPNTTSMGLEAPGQLRAGVFNASGNPHGLYRYAYGDATQLQYSIPSRWVSADSQQIYVTLFEAMANESPDVTRDNADTAQQVKIEIIRQKYGDSWYRLDTFSFNANQPVVYLDNNADGASWGGSGTTEHYDTDIDVNFQLFIAYNNRRPGALRYNSVADSLAGVPSLDFHAVRRPPVEDTFWVTYTYWNPLTGAESPFGPVVKSHKTGATNSQALSDITVLAGDTLCTAWTKGFTKIYERAPWIRLYRTEAGDSTVFYCMAQLRANRCWPNDSTVFLQYTVFPGAVHDSMLTVGQPTQVLTDSAVWPYKQALIPLADDGTALIRPPYIEQMDLGLVDLAYANGRFWGIGDPSFPQRVFHSHYDNPYEWSANGYLPLNENEADELVALEVIPGGALDVIVAMKHNSIYELIGYDPEYDLTWRTIDSKVGALNRNSVVRHGNSIYFMSMDMRFYEYSNSRGLREISPPIENYIDTLFGSASAAAQTLFVYAMQDKIVLSDTAGKRALVYVPRTEQWPCVESYRSSFEPVGSFHYDSSRTNFSQDQFDYWIYNSDSTERFVTEFAWPTTGAIYDTINGATYNFTTKYRTPYIGDGQALYRITKVDIIGRWTNGLLVVRIKNGFGSQLDSVSVLDSADPPGRLRTIGLPNHVGSNLALEFSSGSAVQRVDIHSVTIYYQRVARAYVQ